MRAQILLRKLPFEEIMTYESWYETIAVKNLRPQILYHLPAPVRGVLQQAWHTDPHTRPPASELVAAFSQLLDHSGGNAPGKLDIDCMLILQSFITLVVRAYCIGRGSRVTDDFRRKFVK